MLSPNFIFNQGLIYACLEIIIQECIWQNILKSNWIQIIFTRNDLSISQNCRLKQIIAFFQLFSMLLQRHTFFRFFIRFCSFKSLFWYVMGISFIIRHHFGIAQYKMRCILQRENVMLLKCAINTKTHIP